MLCQRAEGGVRLPPNLSKILFHWGLRDVLLSKASVTTRLLFMQCKSPVTSALASPLIRLSQMSLATTSENTYGTPIC